MRGESDGVTERKEQDMAKDQDKKRIAISMFNWGPCVIRLKINEEFQNKLLEEAKQNTNHRLIEQRTEQLDKLSVEFAARRMDRSINDALSGKQVKQL